jgi:hypothetical protein
VKLIADWKHDGMSQTPWKPRQWKFDGKVTVDLSFEGKTIKGILEARLTNLALYFRVPSISGTEVTLEIEKEINPYVGKWIKFSIPMRNVAQTRRKVNSGRALLKDFTMTKKPLVDGQIEYTLTPKNPKTFFANAFDVPATSSEFTTSVTLDKNDMFVDGWSKLRLTAPEQNFSFDLTGKKLSSPLKVDVPSGAKRFEDLVKAIQEASMP